MKSKVFAIVSAFILVISIIGSTLALVYFRSDITSINLNSEPSISRFINYESGNPVLGSEGKILEVGSSYTSGISTEIEFWKTETAKNMDIYGHIYIDIVSGSSELLNMEGLKWTVTTFDVNSNEILISEGNFVNYEEGDSVPILVNHKLLSALTNFKIYIWIDESKITNASIQGENFSTSIRCEATTGEYDSSIYKLVYSEGTIATEYTFDFIDETIQNVELNSGAYKLEVWGAQGGNATSDYIGGYGGYSVGNITINSTTTLYIVVGGQGLSGNPTIIIEGGYNGGGSVEKSDDLANNRYVAGGGGATHIALTTGELKSLSENRSDILIVAGGGGGGYKHTGGAYYGIGGDGGGYIGNDGSKGTAGGANYGLGGSQTEAGYADGDNTYGIGGFGYGGSVGSSAHGSGGGGGFFGGGGSAGLSGKSNSSGGGGSGYIQNHLLTNKAMYCYGCQTSEDELTKTISVEEASESPISGVPKIGNGYAKITAYGMLVSQLLSRVTINYGDSYDFKTMGNRVIDDSQYITYSTYTNASELSVGEYQIKYIAVDEEDNEYIYYQKVEIK